MDNMEPMEPMDRSEQSGQQTRKLPRARKVRLPADRRQSIGQVIAFVQGAEEYEGALALDQLRTRVAGYVDPGGPEALQELAEHLPVLEALFLKFAAEAVASRSLERNAQYLRMALQAQTAYSRTLALVQGLVLQQKGVAQVKVSDE